MSGNENSPRRRDVLRAGAGAGLFTITGVATSDATARGEAVGRTETKTQEADSPEGYSVEVVAPHATFAEDVAITFQIDADAEGEVSEEPAAPAGTEELVGVSDASTVVVAEATWEPAGTTGWHVHPGPVVINVVEGELEIVDDDCTTTTYASGDAFIDTGQHAHLGRNPSDDEPAVAYATFFGVPDGESATEWVEPRDC